MTKKHLIHPFIFMLMGLTNSAHAGIFYNQSEQCPVGYTLATAPSDAREIQAMCDQMGKWDIAKLADHNTISGSGYHCQIQLNDTDNFGHAFCIPTTTQISNNDSCPTGFSHITPNEVRKNTSKYCDMLPPTGAARIGDNMSLSGISGHCEMHSLAHTGENISNELHQVGVSLCDLESRVKSNSNCPNGTEFLQGSNTPNYCINIGSTSKWDHLGTDMCAVAGKGDFIEVKRIFPNRKSVPEHWALNENNQAVVLAPGTPTVICSEKPLPTYSASGHIAACPLGTELVKGQSANEHCAYIWGQPGLDNLGNDVCEAFGGFDKYIYRVPRAPRALAWSRYTNPTVLEGEPGHTERVYDHGQRIAICKEEIQPEIDADGKLACPPYAELILSASAGDHCALLGGDPGYDLNNDKTVCSKAGEGGFVRYLTNSQGQKIMVCENETQVIPEAMKLVQTMTCPAGEEFIKSPSIQPRVYDHCAITGENTGHDSSGNNVCLTSDMAGFKEYTYPGGVKTLFCECPVDKSGCNGSGDAPRANGSGGNQSTK